MVLYCLCILAFSSLPADITKKNDMGFFLFITRSWQFHLIHVFSARPIRNQFLYGKKSTFNRSKINFRSWFFIQQPSIFTLEKKRLQYTLPELPTNDRIKRKKKFYSYQRSKIVFDRIEHTCSMNSDCPIVD